MGMYNFLKNETFKESQEVFQKNSLWSWLWATFVTGWLLN